MVIAAEGRLATLYTCGITPYDATHLGHAATFIALDLLVRAWRDAGHDVRYVQNVSDVDDPLLERAAVTGEDWQQLAEREVAGYRLDMEALRLLPPDHFVGAAEGLGVIERFTRMLADRGALYYVDGDVYFARSADPLFGSLSGLDVPVMTALFAERGGDPGRPGKKDPLDPLIWLRVRPGEPAVESELGRGRPGWHVQCAAIATEYLGPTFDIQGGGSDLVFPHHEMSASHARVAQAAGSGPAGPAFARRYVHAGMVGLNGQKMSKSLGNLVFVSALRSAGTDPMAIRLAILAHHYGEDWDWTDGSIAPAMKRLARWRSALTLLSSGRLRSARLLPSGESVLAAVRERLSDNLDAPGALAVVDTWAGAIEVAGGLASPTRTAPRQDGAPGLGDAHSLGVAGVPVPGDAEMVRDTVDALLGVAL